MTTPLFAVSSCKSAVSAIRYSSKRACRSAEGTHEPIIDRETFDKARALSTATGTLRSRNYDFLLKGLSFCHERGYPPAVLNRKNAAGEDKLYFVCRTYQSFTVCTSHTIKEQTVTQSVIEKVQEACWSAMYPAVFQ